MEYRSVGLIEEEIEMIQVVHCKRFKGAMEYVGRPSPLGNPFVLHNESERKRVIEQYEEWLDKALRENINVRREFVRLAKIAHAGDLNIACWCSPRACHGDVIKKKIEEVLA